jgi:hypothetical protein
MVLAGEKVCAIRHAIGDPGHKKRVRGRHGRSPWTMVAETWGRGVVRGAGIHSATGWIEGRGCRGKLV